jgi:hypothetical protein
MVRENKLLNFIAKELCLRIDFVNLEFQIGWIWVILGVFVL